MSTPGDRPEPPAGVMSRTVVIDGERWLVCPVDGPGCVRVCVSRLGETWAADVIDYHLTKHHSRPWR